MTLLVVLYVIVLLAVIAVIITGLVMLVRDILAARKAGGRWEEKVPPLFTWRFLAALAIAVVVAVIAGLASRHTINWFGVIAAGIEAGLAADLGRYLVQRWGKRGWWEWAWAAALVAAAILALRAVL